MTVNVVLRSKASELVKGEGKLDYFNTFSTDFIGFLTDFIKIINLVMKKSERVFIIEI